jgi:hypothetical protein
MSGNWRKSARSVAAGNCVEVSSESLVMVRDTTDREGVTLSFSADTWNKFVTSL